MNLALSIVLISACTSAVGYGQTACIKERCEIEMYLVPAEEPSCDIEMGVLMSDDESDKQRKLDLYLAVVMSHPAMLELRERAFRDLALWGSISPETKKLRDEFIARMTEGEP